MTKFNTHKSCLWQMRGNEDWRVRWEVAKRIEDQNKLWQMKNDEAWDVKEEVSRRIG